VIAILSKPPAASSLANLLERIKNCKKPVVGCFLGVDPGQLRGSPNLQPAGSIDEAVGISIANVNGQATMPVRGLTTEELAAIRKEKKAWSSEQKYLRGILAGGTFCYQSQQILREAGYIVHSNNQFDKKPFS
jgi:FdrA protein